MNNLLLTLFVLVGLLGGPLAVAQDDPAPAANAPAEEAGIPVADAPEAEAPEADAPEGDEPDAEAEAEGDDEAEAGGDDEAEAGGDEVEAEGDEPAAELDAADAIASVSTIIELFKSGAWPLGLGLLLTLLVAVANKFGLKDKVGSKWVPWLSMGLAVAASVGVSLVAELAAMDAVIAGVTAGLAAVGGWEMLIKHIPAFSTKSAEA